MLIGSLILPPNTLANRPAPQIDGRLYFATDTATMYRDNVAQWVTVGAGGSSAVDTSRFFRAAFNGSRSLSGGFNTFVFGSGDVTNDAATPNYSTTTGFYTVPKAGVYRTIARARFTDASNSQPSCGYAVAVGKNGGDNDFPQWGNLIPNFNGAPRNGLYVEDVRQFAQGDTIRTSLYLEDLSHTAAQVIMIVEGL